MAYAFRAAGTANTNNLSSTGTTALPAGVASGDLLIAVLSVSQGGSGSTVPTISTPSGWTAAPSTPLINQTTNAGITLAVYYRWATGSDTGPSWAFGSTFKYAARVFAWSGGPGSGTPAITYGNGQSGSSSTSNTTGTDTASSQWFAETYSERSTTNASYTTPAGTTLRGSQFGSGGAASDLLLVDSNGTASGTVGGDTAVAGTAASWGANALIVFPASAFTGTGAATETATIAGSGSATGTGSVAEAASIAGAGGGTGAAAVTVTAAIAGAGGAQGTGSVVETATIAGSGSANYTKTGSQTVTASIAGAGGGTGPGSVTVAAAIAGTGRVSASGAVSVTAAIAGSGQASGAGAVTVTAAIAGSASGALSGTGAQTVTATVAGSGRPSGTGAVAVAAAIAGSGAVGFTGTGAVTVTATIAGSAPQSYYFNDAEDGTNGAAVTAATGSTADGSTNFGTVVGNGALIYDNTHALDGTLSFKVTTDGVGDGRYGLWDSTQMPFSAPQYASELLYLPSLPSSFLQVGTVRNTSGTAVLSVFILNTGKVELTVAGGAFAALSTTSVPAGSTFRLEFAVLVASATVGQVQARIFTSPYGTTPTETVTTAANVNTTALPPGQVRTGFTGPASYSYWFDQFRTSNVAYPPAPTSPVLAGSGSPTVTAAIAGSGILGYVGTGAVTATAAIAGTGFAPGSGAGSLPITATIAGAGVVSNGASLTTTAGITGTGRTSTTGAVSAVVGIAGTGALASTITPRTATSGSGNSQIVTTTLPTGTTAGDLLLCHLSVSQGGSAFTQPTINTPSGWTLIPVSAGSNPLVSQGTNAGLVGAWYYRWATGTDTAPSWTLNTGSTFYKNAWIVEAYAGGPGSGAPRLLSGAGATGGSPVTTNTTGTTALTPASWYVETYSERSTTNTAYTNPSGRTRRAAVFGSGGAAADMLWVDSNLSAAGTVGGDTATDDGTGAAWQIHGLIVFPALTGASVPVQATITGSGSVNSPNTASLAVTALVSGTGVVTGFNPGLFVPSVVKPRYTLQLVDAPHLGTSSAVVGDLQMASGKSLTFNTPDASTLTWTMPGAHPESVLVGGAGLPGLWEMCTDAIIWRDIGPGPTKLARLRVVSGVDSSADSGDSETVAWTGSDYKAVFASRQIIEGDKGTVSSGGLSFPASTDVASIAWDLVNAAQSKTNGNMGIAKSLDGWSGGGVANTGKTFGSAFIVTPGTDLKSALDTLLAGDTSTPAGAAGGFDWWIDAELELHIKARNQVSPNPPGRGTASLFVADYHGTVRSFSRTPVIDAYANQVRADGGVTPSVHTSPTLATDPYGRVERNITVTVNTTQTPAQQDALVSQVGAEALYVGNLPAASYTLVLTQGVWDPALLGVGDNVQVVIQAGRLAVNTLQRVLALQVDISDDGAETVTLTTARPDVANWVADQLAKLGARIKGLELRI